VEFDHFLIEQEGALVREPLRRDLVLRVEPGIEGVDIDVSENEVDVGVVRRRSEADQLRLQPPTRAA
jgi:hypothetical protein